MGGELTRSRVEPTTAILLNERSIKLPLNLCLSSCRSVSILCSGWWLIRNTQLVKVQRTSVSGCPDAKGTLMSHSLYPTLKHPCRNGNGKMIIAWSQGGAEENSALWTFLGHRTHEFTAAMVTCRGPSRDQASQCSRIEWINGQASIYQCGATDTYELSRENSQSSLKMWLLVVNHTLVEG